MQLLRVRYYQIRRDLQFSFFLLLGVMVWLSYALYEAPSAYAWHYSALVLFVLIYLQRNRRDLAFLHRHANKPYLQLLAEHQLVLLPVTLPALYQGQWRCALALHAATCLVPLIRTSTSEPLRFRFLARWIPAQQYEWLAGMRQQLPVLLPFYLISLVLSSVKLFPLVALWILNLSIQNFYNTCEPVHVLHALPRRPADLLMFKLRFAIRCFIYINGPILLVNLLVHPDGLIPVCLFTLYSITGISLAICTKYSQYKPGEMSQGNTGPLIISNMALFSPYLLPIPILMLWRNWRKALKNLDYYI